ncbi:MAG: alpha-hydroxy acid oxidase, partial [Gammaproteobacteria bacterium]
MNCINLDDYRQEARRRLRPDYFDYFDGGAQDEVTLRANATAFDAITLRPRVLTGGLGASHEEVLGIDLLGSASSMPVFISPTAFHRLAHPDGECATAAASQEAGITMTISMASTMPVEEIVASMCRSGETPNCWFQLYVQPDRGFTAELVNRVQAAGCSAVVVTADSPAFGRHERDLRHGFVDLPAGLHCAHMKSGDRNACREIEFDPTLCWKDIDWLRSITDLPLVVKGIAHPEDARLAVSHGVSAVYVSNHGGRQLDT